MSKLVAPHGSPALKALLVEGKERQEALEKAKRLKKIPMTSRESSDLIMMGIGAFTPLEGFMRHDDWKGCCNDYKLPSKGGLFWPIPITLSASQEDGKAVAIGEDVALWDTETSTIMGIMKVADKYTIDKEHECKQVFRTTDPAHPGVKKVMEQGPVNLAGPVTALSESYYPDMFAGIYQRPAAFDHQPRQAGRLYSGSSGSGYSACGRVDQGGGFQVCIRLCQDEGDCRARLRREHRRERSGRPSARAAGEEEGGAANLVQLVVKLVVALDEHIRI